MASQLSPTPMFEGQDFFWNSFYQSCFLLQPNSIDLTAKYCSLREGNSALMSTAYKESHPSVGYLPSCCNKHFWISDFLPQFSPPMASGCTCVLHKPIISPTSLCSLNNYACDKKATCSCAFRFTQWVEWDWCRPMPAYWKPSSYVWLKTSLIKFTSMFFQTPSNQMISQHLVDVIAEQSHWSCGKKRVLLSLKPHFSSV